jgi:EAL domain-containing protein (putative c-di-GMP-specific phosphodiesterase class I)
LWHKKLDLAKYPKGYDAKLKGPQLKASQLQQVVQLVGFIFFEKGIMIIKKAVEQVIESGVKPIILDLQRVVDFSSDVQGIRSSLVIKSLNLGTLTANEYRYIARRTNQGSKLVERNIEKLFFFFDDIKKEFSSSKFFTISVYARSIIDGQLTQALIDNFEKFPSVDPTMICIELSADILFEDIDKYKIELEKIKQLGVKIALCEVAQEFCPLLRLNGIEYDYIFLDGYFTRLLDNEEKQGQISGVMGIIESRPCKIYGSCVEDEYISLLEKVGADGYTKIADAKLVDKEWRVGGIEDEAN